MTKAEIRGEMRRRRQAVTPAERARQSARLCARLRAMKLAEPIAVYLAASDEIDLTAFIAHGQAHGMRLVAPRWQGAAYELAELTPFWPDGLVEGPHAILEPPREAPVLASTRVGTWLVPGLAFTRAGARLGYGGGWYDRLMCDSKARKIGVGYDFQLLDDLPVEPHDIRLDAFVDAGTSDLIYYPQKEETMDNKKEEKILSNVIRAMEGAIFADGKIDMDETGILLRLVKPLADDYGNDFRAFAQAIRDVRADGVVTPEESERLRQLIAAMADRADSYKVVKCPACERPLSTRTTDAGEVACPWCGHTLTF